MKLFKMKASIACNNCKQWRKHDVCWLVVTYPWANAIWVSGRT